MEITLFFKPTTDGFRGSLAVLPDFSVNGSSKNELLESLPTTLKNFIKNWEASVIKDSEQFTRELPYIQRIKARGYYQSTLFRLTQLIDRKDLNKVDMEIVHCLQRKGFEELLTS